MSILRGFKFFPVFLVILVSLFSPSTFLSNGYCDDWVYVGSYKEFINYYNSSSVKIDKQNKIISVLMINIYTTEGKQQTINKYGAKYTDIKYGLSLILLNYKDWKSNIAHVTEFTKSDKVLYDGQYPPKWEDIIPDYPMDYLLNKLLKDYEINEAIPFKNKRFQGNL